MMMLHSYQESGRPVLLAPLLDFSDLQLAYVQLHMYVSSTRRSLILHIGVQKGNNFSRGRGRPVGQSPNILRPQLMIYAAEKCLHYANNSAVERGRREGECSVLCQRSGQSLKRCCPVLREHLPLLIAEAYLAAGTRSNTWAEESPLPFRPVYV